jgi:hypothetical protein
MPSSETIHQATELLNGALRKVAVTQYHARELAQVLEESTAAQCGPVGNPAQA